MQNLLTVLPDEKQGDLAAGELRIVQAYAAVFGGRGSKDDADLVLVDLAQFTRYLDTTSLEAPPAYAAAVSHRRAVFSRIVEAVTAGGGNLNGLQQAVLTAPDLTAPSEET